MEILIEMEGTVFDLNSGIADLLHTPVEELTITKTGEIDYEAVHSTSKKLEKELAGQSETFWKGIEPIASGLEIIKFIKAEGIPFRIVTRPYDTHNSQSGKKAWVEEHIGSETPLTFTRSKHVFANRTNLLIDERPGNIQAFKRSGGNGILIPRSWQLNYKGQTDIVGYCISQIEALMGTPA